MLSEINEKRKKFLETGSCYPEKEYYRDSYTGQLIPVYENKKLISKKIEQQKSWEKRNTPKYLMCPNCNHQADYQKDKGYKGVICSKCNYSWNPFKEPKPRLNYKEWISNKQQVAKEKEIDENITKILSGKKIKIC